MKKCLLLTLSLLSVAHLANGAVAFQLRTIYESSFDDATYSASGNTTLGGGWESRGPEDKEYNVASSGELAIRDANGGEGNFDSLNQSFNGLTLATVGERVDISFDYQVVDEGNGVSNSNNGIRFGFVGGTNGNGNDGYGLYIASGSNSSNHIRPMTSVNSAYAGAVGSAAVFNSVEGLYDSATLRLEVSAYGELTLSGSVGGVAIAPVVAPNYYRLFDEFGFSAGGLNQGIRIDNFRVDYLQAVPEPQTASLILLALLMFRALVHDKTVKEDYA